MSWNIIEQAPAALLIAAVGAADAGSGAGRCRAINRRFRELTGYDRRQIRDVGRWLARVQADRPQGTAAARLRQAVRAAPAARPFEACIVRKDGQARWFAIDVARCEGDAEALYAMVFTDITERVGIGHRLERLARADPLTGLLSRQSLLERHAAAAASGYGLLLCDVDGFRRINERHGHAAGDAVLVRCAARLRRLAGPAALVARWEGDRFAVLVPGGRAAALHRLAGRIARGAGATSPAVTLTIGGTWAAAGTPIAEALRRAAGALGFGKSAGRNRVEFD